MHAFLALIRGPLALGLALTNLVPQGEKPY